VRNNIFAFCNEGQVAFPKPDAEGYISVTFIRNIVMTHNQPAFIGGALANLDKGTFVSNVNLFWDTANAPFLSGNGDYDAAANWEFSRYFSFEQWNAIGQDRQSIIADPRIDHLEADSFTIAEDSPALTIGFRPFQTARR
jgi:hypothetical protein